MNESKTQRKKLKPLYSRITRNLYHWIMRIDFTRDIHHLEKCALCRRRFQKWENIWDHAEKQANAQNGEDLE